MDEFKPIEDENSGDLANYEFISCIDLNNDKEVNSRKKSAKKFFRVYPQYAYSRNKKIFSHVKSKENDKDQPFPDKGAISVFTTGALPTEDSFQQPTIVQIEKVDGIINDEYYQGTAQNKYGNKDLSPHKYWGEFRSNIVIKNLCDHEELREELIQIVKFDPDSENSETVNLENIQTNHFIVVIANEERSGYYGIFDLVKKKVKEKETTGFKPSTELKFSQFAAISSMVQDSKITIVDGDGNPCVEYFLKSKINEYFEEQEKDIEEQVNQIICGINDSVLDTSNKILESETLSRVITGIKDQPTEKRSSIKTYSENDFYNPENDSDIVTALSNRILQERPELTNNDIINYFTCLIQGYITVFAGSPGSGKTSLCNILGDITGLKSHSRFVEIDIEHGWTSPTDYIGYYSPLTKQYEEVNRDIFSAFELLNEEASKLNSDYAKIPPFVFLLDEANLSPIEHYWSPFLRACDKFNDRNTKLPLGGSKNFLVPPYVRFLATINFDHTTETLSPRFLDRCWVITLESTYSDPNLSTGDSTDERDNQSGDDTAEKTDLTEGQCDSSADSPDNDFEPIEKNQTLSYEKLTSVFGETDASNEKTKEVLNNYSNFKTLCASCGLPISYRSDQMMTSYIKTAEELASKLDLNDFNSLDYAISQKYLPQLSGSYNEMFIILLTVLKDFFEGKSLEKGFELPEGFELPQCKKRIKKMLNSGEENGFVQFFV